MRRILLLCTIMAAGCGGSSSTPAGPNIASANGTWSGNVQQTSASGGPECLLVFLGQNGSTDQDALQISQTNTALTATQTSINTGSTCQMTGTAATSSITLSATACAPTMVTGVCNGNARDIYLSTRTLTANITGNLLNGTITDHWNVYASGDTATLLGVVVVTSSVVMGR